MEQIVNAEYQVVQERTLPVIASEIKIIEQQTAKTVLENGIQIGIRLQEAKEQVGHGNFEEWCKENLNYTSRTARKFMQLATEYGDENGLISNRNISSDLSISKALTLLKVPEDDREEFVEEHDVDTMTVKELEDAVREAKEEAEQANAQLKAREDSEADLMSQLEKEKKSAESAKEKLKKEKEALKDDVNAEKPAHIQKQNPDVIKEDVFLEQASVLAHKQLDELKALKDRAERVGVLGANGSKILAAGFYFVKKNAGGEPLSEDEKRKADHNKKWIAAWNKWLDTKDPQKGGSYFENRMEETKARRTIMSYYSRFLRDMVRTPIPYSNEMYCSATARIFASRDPYTFLNLQTAVEGMELLKGQFEDEMKTVEQDIGGLTEFGNTIEAMKKIVSGDGADCRQHLADYQKNYKK